MANKESDNGYKIGISLEGPSEMPTCQGKWQIIYNKTTTSQVPATVTRRV